MKKHLHNRPMSRIIVMNYYYLVIKGGNMSRMKKRDRQLQLQEKLNTTPFLTDEELATFFGVSVPTIRLDRLELGIPELRERIKAMAEGHSHDSNEQDRPEVVGDLIDLTAGEQGISIVRTTGEMTDYSGYVEPQYLYAQADSLAKAVLGVPVAVIGVGNIKYKSPVKANCNLIAKASVMRRRGDKYFIWVTIKDKLNEVFRAKMIMEPIENRV